MRVTLEDGSRLVLQRPEIVGDSLYGTPRDAGPSAGRPRPAVALAAVREVAVRRVNVVGTAALTLTTVALAGVIAIGVLWSNRAD
jgi:hypothetical protein